MKYPALLAQHLPGKGLKWPTSVATGAPSLWRKSTWPITASISSWRAGCLCQKRRKRHARRRQGRNSRICWGTDKLLFDAPRFIDAAMPETICPAELLGDCLARPWETGLIVGHHVSVRLVVLLNLMISRNEILRRPPIFLLSTTQSLLVVVKIRRPHRERGRAIGFSRQPCFRGDGCSPHLRG
jgi:hypothetical protein